MSKYFKGNKCYLDFQSPIKLNDIPPYHAMKTLMRFRVITMYFFFFFFFWSRL